MAFKSIDLEKFNKKFKIKKLGKNQYITKSKHIEFREEFTEGFGFKPIDLMYLMNRASYYFSHYFRHLYAINKISSSSNVVLDLGCGSAFVRDLIHRSTYIGKTEYIGVDAEYKSLVKATELRYGKFLLINDDITGDLPYIKSKGVDVVLAMEIYEHLTEKQGDAFINGIARMLKKGGKLVLSTPNSDLMHRDFHIREYTIEEVKSKLFKYFEIDDIVGWDNYGGAKVENSFSKRDRIVFNQLTRYMKPAVLRRIFLGIYPELASAVIYSCIRK